MLIRGENSRRLKLQLGKIRNIGFRSKVTSKIQKSQARTKSNICAQHQSQTYTETFLKETIQLINNCGDTDTGKYKSLLMTAIRG